jgi:hypothetical protein
MIYGNESGNGFSWRALSLKIDNILLYRSVSFLKKSTNIEIKSMRGGRRGLYVE